MIITSAQMATHTQTNPFVHSTALLAATVHLSKKYDSYAERLITARSAARKRGCEAMSFDETCEASCAAYNVQSL